MRGVLLNPANVRFVILLFAALAGISQGYEPTRSGTPAQAGGPVAPSTVNAEKCSLTIELCDPSDGSLIPGMVRILDADGNELPLAGLLDRCIGLPKDFRKLGWHTVMGKATVEVPANTLRIEAVSGLERENASREVKTAGKESIEIRLPLPRFSNLAEGPWVAGNTHLHLKDLSKEEANRYLTEVSRADGLSLVFVSYLERALVDRNYTTNQHTRADLATLSGNGLVFGNGEEYRHNFSAGGEGYGHVMFLDLEELILPASVGPGITKEGFDDTPLRGGIQQARTQGATVIWCHNQFGFENFPNWLAGLVHAQNIFDGGNRGTYHDTFYRFLDVGLRVPFSTGTDWFVYDFSRVYAACEQPEQIRVDDWLRALRAGNTFITNSALLEFSAGPESAPPGGTIEQEEEKTISLRGKAIGRHDFGRLQLVQRGKVIAETPARRRAGHFTAELKFDVSVSDSTWFALRIDPDIETLNEMGRQLFAHTSAIHVEVAGRPVFDENIAEELIKETQANLVKIAELGVFSSDEAHQRVIAVYQEAIERLKNPDAW